MRPYSCSRAAVSSLLLVGLILFASAAPVAAFTISLSSADFERTRPIFSEVSNVSIDVEMAGELEAGRVYGNESVLSVSYRVNGQLASGTPSGFTGFNLDRTSGGEGIISGDEWRSQGSSILFETAATANLLDGLQVSDLVGRNALRIDAREFERADVSRYHPPFLILRSNGSLLLKSSNNGSGASGTINPQTGLSVDLDYRDEYVSRFSNTLKTRTAEPLTIASPVPEPGTAILMGLGLAGLAAAGRRRS